MSKLTAEANIDKMFEEEIAPKELIILSIPVSILFAISGMDFIGYFIYLGTRATPDEVYTRSLPNVLLIGFLSTAVVLLLVPFLINKYRWKRPFSYFGNQIGNWIIGLIVVGIVVLVSPLLYFNSQNQLLINTYPLTKDFILDKWFYFILYELAYVVFYYIPYEFYFRGILQLGLSKSWKKWQSIMFVTILTTVLHVTKPWMEIVAALVAGVIFGIIAEKTDSWIYVFFIHIIVGVLSDSFCGLGFLGVL